MDRDYAAEALGSPTENILKIVLHVKIKHAARKCLP